jgi:hypothetical protein
MVERRVLVVNFPQKVLSKSDGGGGEDGVLCDRLEVTQKLMQSKAVIRLERDILDQVGGFWRG